MTTYLDWNATTPRHPEVVAAMRAAEADGWANPSSTHQAGRAARRYMEDAREVVARLVKVSPRDVVFTGGGTEANHLALSGARWLVTSRIEHPSIVSQAERLATEGARVAFARVSPEGVVTADAIEEALSLALNGVSVPAHDPDLGGLDNLNTPLVAVSAANHETGVIQPLEAIRDVARARGARLHVDAVQFLGRCSEDLPDDLDSVSLAAHKLRGPKGLGALAFACGWTPLAMGSGGAQERGLRPGTIDASALAGLSAAAKRLEVSKAGYRSAGELGKEFERCLIERAATPITVHGAGAQRLSHIVNFRAGDWKGDELVAALDLKGVCVSSGSACSAGTAEPSKVIEEMLGRAAAVGAVRVSFGEDSSRADLEAILQALIELKVLKPA